MTELTLDGMPADPAPAERERCTPTMKYPLPPEAPTARIVYDGWGRYTLPSPSTGRPTAYSRSTSIAGTLDDEYHLTRWKSRTQLAAVLKFQKRADAGDELARELLAELYERIADGNGNATNKVLDRIDVLCGGRDAAELGTAIHAWLEAVDIGTAVVKDVPEMFRPYVDAYQGVLARHGLVAVPEYVERVVLNERGIQTIAGTLDRIYRVQSTGELILGDVKSSKTLDFGWLNYATQFAVYGYATKMLKMDASGWEPMPEINQEYAICLHVPSDTPEMASAVTFDLWFGGEAMQTALLARKHRADAKTRVPYKHAIPVPTREALRYVEARQALQNISHPDDLNRVWEQYRDVWTDELTQFGEQVAKLFTANAHANAEGVAP